MHEPTVTRVEFHDHGAKTRMTLTDGPYPAGGGHAEAGWNEAFDKLNDAPRGVGTRATEPAPHESVRFRGAGELPEVAAHPASCPSSAGWGRPVCTSRRRVPSGTGVSVTSTVLLAGRDGQLRRRSPR